MLYLPRSLLPRCTSMHFGENQLSPRSFGISPLPTAPLTDLQLGTVRASTSHYGRFTLAMGSSRGFGSHNCNSRARLHERSRPLQTRFRSGYGPQALSLHAAATNSPVHSSIGTPSGPPHTCLAARVTPLPSDRSSADGFRFSFTPLTGVLFTVPSRYYPLSVAVVL